MNAFHTTQWSLVLAARNEDGGANAALATLCERYREPVLAYVKSFGNAAQDAEDLTQAFFVRLLEQRYDRRADPTRGRFRSFLLGALKHFLADTRDAALTAKRGGGVAHEGWDEGVLIADAAPTPERAFERAFAFTVIERALWRLQQQAEAAGKGAQLSALSPLLVQSRESGALKALSQRLGVRANTLAVALKRWRTKLSELIREELAETVNDSALLEGEFRALREALRSSE